MSKSVDKAYAAIRQAIADQHFQPGERLTEERLAEQIGVSRTPVREALRRLSADGILELLPNLGARLPSWSMDELDEIFGLRQVLEAYGAELAAVRISPAQLAELRQLCDSMERLAAGRRPASSRRSRSTTGAITASCWRPPAAPASAGSSARSWRCR